MRLQDLFARLWNPGPCLPRQRQRQVPLLMALEPRIMFDAAVAATAEQAVNAHSSAHSPEAAVPAGDSHAVEAARGPADSAREAQRNAGAGTQARHEVVFVDPGVPDYQALVQHLPSGTEVVVLDASSDGLSQMARYLQGRQGLDAIHLISEGQSGGVKAGSTWIDGASLSAHAADLQAIGAALAEQGDLLLYGCKVGDGSQGQAFIDALARLTGADVAASSDWTGAAALGGNWTLERQSGSIETPAIIDADAASAYSHLLNTLQAGDIVVTGWNSFNDTVTLMTLVDIAPDTVIKITDKGWNLNATPTAAFTTSTTGDGVVTWTTTSQVDAGTVLRLFLGGADQPTTLTNLTTGAVLTGEITQPAYTVNDPMPGTGDGIFVYQDADTNPYFIFGFNNSAGTVDGTNWNTSIGAQLPDSMLPNGNGSQNALVTGINGDAIGAPRDSNGVQQDNVQYIGPTGAADRATWLALITAQANWTGDDTGITSSTVVTTPGTVFVAPVIGLFGGDTVSYREGDSFVALDAGSDATVSDADSANFDGGRLAVSIDNPVASEDVLAVRNEGSGAGQIGVAGTSITYGGVIIGSASGGTGTQDLVIALNANATPEATQALVRNLVYTNSNGIDPTTGVRTVLVSLDDGEGGSVTTAPISVNVVAVNDAPTLTATGGSVGYTENGAPVDLFSSVAISTVEPGQNISQIVLGIDHVGSGGQDILTIDGTDFTLDQPGSRTTAVNGLTIDLSVNAGTATIAISRGPNGFDAATAQALVDGLAYRNTSDAPDTRPRQVSIVSIRDTGGTLDGGVDTSSPLVQTSVTIIAVNDAPTLSLPSSIAVIEDTALPITGIAIADVDAGNATVVLSLTVDSGALAAGPAGGVGVQGSGGSALTLAGNVSDINAFIAGGNLSFTPAPDATGDVALAVTVDDGGNSGIDPGTSGTASSESTSGSVVLTVAAVNDAPVDGVPGAQRVTHDSVLVFGSSNGNALSVTDVDAGNSPVRVTLTATNGALTLPRTTGLTMLVGSGGNDASMSFEGSIADINAALEGLAFTPTPGFVGPASLRIDSNDLGATGSGGPQTDSDIVGITVDPDRPQVASVHAANADGTYMVGNTITLTITFDQVVMLDTTAGTPTLLLETGAIDRNATYVAGSGSRSLSFQYVVQPGDSSPDLDYAGMTALQLNGATLRNPNGTDALLALPPAGGAGSIAGPQQITVDGIAPTIVDISPLDASPTSAESVRYSVQFSEPVSGMAASDFTLVTQGSAKGAVQSIAQVDAQTYTVVVGQLTGTGRIALHANAASGGVSDTAGNRLAGDADGAPYVLVPPTAGGPSPSPAPSPAAPSPPSTPSGALPLPVMPAPATALDANARLASDALPAMVLPSNGLDVVEATDAVGTLAAGAAPPELLLNPRIGEFSAAPGQALYIGLPAWVTMRSNATNPILVEARLADGRPLPDWLRFDPVAGTITGRPPLDANQTLHIELIAHDPRGERASSFLDLEVKPPPPGTGALHKGRPSLSEQFDRRDAAGHRVHAALLRHEAARRRMQ